MQQASRVSDANGDLGSNVLDKAGLVFLFLGHLHYLHMHVDG